MLIDSDTPSCLDQPGENSAATATVEENGQAAEPEPSNDEQSDWGYTPMSEWGDLDDRNG